MQFREWKRFVVEEAGLGLNDGPMFGPGGEQHQRINIATPGTVLQRGLQQLIKALKNEYI